MSRRHPRSCPVANPPHSRTSAARTARSLWRLASGLALVLAAWLAGARQADAQSVWDLTPYRIRVLMAVDNRPEFTERLAESMRAVLAERTDTAVGAAWILQSGPAPDDLRPALLDGLAALSVEQVPQSLVELEADKLIFVTLTAGQGGWTIGARELDLQTRLLGTTVSRHVRQRQLLGEEAFQAVLGAFAPLARIEQVEGKQVRLRLRAGGLPPLDPTLSWIGPGSVLRPVIRYNDRDGKPRRIEPLEWTFMAVESLAGAELTSTLHSGLRSPLSGRRRGPVEQVALAVRPSGLPTRLVLKSRTDPQRRLAGYEVYSHPPHATATHLVGRTDGQGELLVPADSAGLRVLLVKNGGELLARLPMLPGLFSVAAAEIPDDDQRLAAEGVITGLQRRFVDIIARRQVLMTRVRARMDEGKLEEAERFMEQLRRLGSHQQFMTMIALERRRTATTDELIQRKIDKLFDDTRQVVVRFLDQRQIDQLESELHALRSQTASAGP